MSHRESNDGITVAETFDRRETIADYFDEKAHPPAGQCLLIQVVDIPEDWFEDYVAVLEQRGRLLGAKRCDIAGGVRLTANGSWPSSVGSAWVLLSSSTIAPEQAQLAGGAS